MPFKTFFRTNTAVLISGIICLAGCTSEESKTEKPAAETKPYSTTLKGSEGNSLGLITITELANGGVTLSVQAENIPSGPHGMHFHVKANCVTPDFKSAGGHINPMGKAHGLMNENGPDNADMPNAVADSSNKVDLEVINDRVDLYPGGNLPALLDADGSALVIHANPDDQITQPIGGAGARIACAEIMQK